jgi:RNA polymerase sigma-70 factor (ECF subfamily)
LPEHRAVTVPTEELIRRYQAGQTDLFDALFERYKDYVYRVAYSLTQHAEESEEVVQETFLDVLKALPRYDVGGPARFETWLYRVTANRCKMRWRRKRLPTVEWEETGEQLAQLPDDHPEHDPEVASQCAETRRRIWRAVGCLSDIYREVVLLRYGHGFSYQEIADALSLSIGTVKSRLNAAHRQLQELIAANGHLAQEIAGRHRRRKRLNLMLLCFA